MLRCTWSPWLEVGRMLTTRVSWPCQHRTVRWFVQLIHGRPNVANFFSAECPRVMPFRDNIIGAPSEAQCVGQRPPHFCIPSRIFDAFPKLRTSAQHAAHHLEVLVRRHFGAATPSCDFVPSVDINAVVLPAVGSMLWPRPPMAVCVPQLPMFQRRQITLALI